MGLLDPATSDGRVIFFLPWEGEMYKSYSGAPLVLLKVRSPYYGSGGGTLGISGWGCAAGTLEPLTYTRASSAEFCYPILE